MQSLRFQLQERGCRVTSKSLAAQALGGSLLLPSLQFGLVQLLLPHVLCHGKSTLHTPTRFILPLLQSGGHHLANLEP